jgi:hypothetical protein
LVKGPLKLQQGLQGLERGRGIVNINDQKFLYVPEIGIVSLTVSVIEISELPGTLPLPGPYPTRTASSLHFMKRPSKPFLGYKPGRERRYANVY